MIDIKTIKLSDYFSYLGEKEIQSVTFIESYCQIHFVHGYMTLFSDIAIKNAQGAYPIPSKEGNWELVQLVGKNVLSVAELEKEVLIEVDGGTAITVNTALGPAGDTFHIQVEDLPKLHL